MCGQAPSANWFRMAGQVADGTAEGSQADKPRALPLKMPVAWLSEPLPPDSRQSCSVIWKEPFLSELAFRRPSSCLPLSNRVNTFLFCCTCQHTSNLLAAGTSPVLVLEPISSLSHFSSIWTRNMPTRISLNFFLNPGLHPKGRCIQTPWSQALSPLHTCLPLHTSRWAMWQSVP